MQVAAKRRELEAVAHFQFIKSAVEDICNKAAMDLITGEGCPTDDDGRGLRSSRFADARLPRRGS